MADQNGDLNSLNIKFGISDVVSFDEKSKGQTVVRINNDFACAEIMLQGAHLIHWQIKNEEPVIWLSEDAVFMQGKSIRGGIPVCWPWFGAHAENDSFPAHGYARTVLWEPAEISQLDDGRTRLVFNLIENTDTRAFFPHQVALTIVYIIGNTLEISLISKNTGAKTIELSEALHTYFKVGDARKITVSGLDACHYLDKPDGFLKKQQQGAVHINEEVDRIYIDTQADIHIDDTLLNRRIVIKKENSDSTVVWNPWKDTADKMGDLGKEGYLNMLCVESANAANNTFSLGAGETHYLNVTYNIEPI